MNGNAASSVQPARVGLSTLGRGRPSPSRAPPGPGLTINLLTPQLCQELAILAEDKGIRGLAGDGSVQVKTVDLKGVTVEQKVPVCGGCEPGPLAGLLNSSDSRSQRPWSGLTRDLTTPCMEM